MTEKRFELIWETDEMCNVFDNDLDVNSTISVEEVVNLLNGLAEENQQCKEYNAKLYSNSMKSEKQLLKQIKELKEENKELRNDKDYWKTLAQSLAKNNGNVELKDEHLAWKRVDVE